jgi:hypothetical protein
MLTFFFRIRVRRCPNLSQGPSQSFQKDEKSFLPILPIFDNVLTFEHTIMPTISTEYRDEEIESVAEDDLGHSLPTPEGQRAAAALENDHSGSGWFDSMSKQRKRMVFGGIGIVICLILIIAVSVSLANRGGGGSSNAQQGSSTSAVSPQSFSAVVEYLAGFEGVFGDRTLLLTPGSPQNLAATWMANDAYVNIPSTDLVGEAFPFVQRYALAVLYYSLSGANWTNQYSFLTHASECERWQQSYTTGALNSALTCGVRCDSTGQLNEIFLRT